MGFEYKFSFRWGTYGTGFGEFHEPCSVALDSSGNVFVADLRNNRIQKFASNGTFIHGWGTYGNGNGQFQNPLGVAVDSSGNVYVADSEIDRIQLFNWKPEVQPGINSLQNESSVTGLQNNNDLEVLENNSATNASAANATAIKGIAGLEYNTTTVNSTRNFTK